MSRTRNTIRNIKYAALDQVISLVANLIFRKIFVVILTSEYLGLSGVFTNILSMLSLAEFGIGTSIIYSLYRPLAEKN